MLVYFECRLIGPFVEMYVVLLQSKILPFVALIDVLHVAGNSVSDTVTNIGLSSVGYEDYTVGLVMTSPHLKAVIFDVRFYRSITL